MNVGFYYHLGAVCTPHEVAMPAHLAMFVEELACQAGRVTYFAHSGPPSFSDDTVLGPPSIDVVDIGPRGSAPVRSFLGGSAVRIVQRVDVDVLLIRAPTPLGPALARAVPCTAFLLVGDYLESDPSSAFRWWRRSLIRAWVALYERRQRRAFRDALVLANSPSLVRRVERVGSRATEVFTSSLSQEDLATLEPPHPWGPGVGQTEPLRILFTGRVVEEKGLGDAIVAVGLLVERGLDVRFDVVGAADDPRYLDKLWSTAERSGIVDRVVFHGYRSAGPELMRVYEQAHLFLLPSRTDAFPRSLTEALAAGLPTVATRVGGIPERLGDRVLLVDPGRPDELAAAVERLTVDADLRAGLVERGRRWATGFTNERSCEEIVGHLREWTA